MFLTSEDIKRFTFDGVDRSLIEEAEKSEHWASSSGEDDPTPDQKLTKMLEERFGKEDREREKEEKKI